MNPAGMNPVNMPRFASQPRPVPFGSTVVATRQAGKFLQRMDFEALAQSTIPQIQVVYGLCILSRIAAAAQRSKNEVRETLTRDSLGYIFWFYATPIVQKLFLKFVPPAHYSRILVQKKTEAPQGNGFLNRMKQINFKLNPLSRWELPSSTQLENRMEQALHYLEEQGVATTSPLYKNKEKVFKQLIKWRRLSTFSGIAMTIALLGIGINLINIAITKKRVAEGKVGL